MCGLPAVWADHHRQQSGVQHRQADGQTNAGIAERSRPSRETVPKHLYTILASKHHEDP
jgi:DNA-binding NarL/FixJ family response regulator